MLFIFLISAYCGYSLTSSSTNFLLLSEHKHCDNTATNSKSENARSRTVTSLWGKHAYGDLLDFTMLRTVYFFKPQIWCSAFTMQNFSFTILSRTSENK